MSKKGKLGFLGGALVGVGLGFLFAPKSGSETRKELGKEISNLWDKVRSMDANEIKGKFENKLKEIESGLKDLDKEKVLSIAKEKASNLKSKTEELVTMAKEAGKPVVENAASSIKKSLTNVTKEVLNKLEEKELRYIESEYILN